jgi:DNA ligase 1
MKFEELVNVYEKLEKTSSGNEMREILGDFFKTVSPDDIKNICYLTLGNISSQYENVVLGLAENSLLKAIAQASGMSLIKVKEVMQKEGDVGLVAEIMLKKKPLTLVPVGELTFKDFFNSLHKLSQQEGEKSNDRKVSILVSLLQKASPKGAKYVSRIALRTLRMGVGDKTILDALSIAYTGDKKSKEILEDAYKICPDLGLIGETLAKEGTKGVQKIKIKVGRPIRMMSAQRVKKISEIKEKLTSGITVEAKYDGERVQAHKVGDEIKLFSRGLDDITYQFPDLVKYLLKYVQADNFIIEGEILPVDSQGNHLTFQKLMERKRKFNIHEYAKKIPIIIKIFDLLYLDNKSYLDKPYLERTEQLNKIVKKSEKVQLSDKVVTDNLDEIEQFFHEQLSKGYEGVIAKSMAEDSYYQAGIRGWNWIKWKKDYMDDLVDTFDLVVVGAFYGKGKRSGGYGALLCATYNDDEDTFETFCKLGTGLTDDFLEQLPKKLEQYHNEKKPARLNIKDSMKPDVWFNPGVVVEVSGAEITKSPNHTCAQGLALRFPRFIQLRENKKAEQATTSKDVKGLVV